MTGRTAGYAWAFGFCAVWGAWASHWWLAGAAAALVAGWLGGRPWQPS